MNYLKVPYEIKLLLCNPNFPKNEFSSTDGKFKSRVNETSILRIFLDSKTLCNASAYMTSVVRSGLKSKAKIKS